MSSCPVQRPLQGGPISSFEPCKLCKLPFDTLTVMTMMALMVMRMKMALAQTSISTFSHIWVFVRQYGVMFVIIVNLIIIIIIHRKVKVSTLKHV